MLEVPVANPTLWTAFADPDGAVDVQSPGDVERKSLPGVNPVT